jgi:alanine dehydrogenase
VHGTVGEVVVGDVSGRTAADGVTVFDSTGLAIQDVATARVVARAAEADGAGEAVDLLRV